MMSTMEEITDLGLMAAKRKYAFRTTRYVPGDPVRDETSFQWQSEEDERVTEDWEPTASDYEELQKLEKSEYGKKIIMKI